MRKERIGHRADENQPTARTHITPLLTMSRTLAALLIFASLLSAHTTFAQTYGPFAYVTNSGDGTVSVFSASSGAPVATVTLPACVEDCTDAPAGLAVTPNGQFVYVAVENQGYVAVINTATNQVSTTINLSSYCDCNSTPEGVAITPNGQYVYVTDPGQGAVVVIATATNTVYDTIFLCSDCETTSKPAGIAITPDGTRAYVADTGLDDVEVITISSNTFSTISLIETCDSCAPSPLGIAITPNGTRAYVTDTAQDVVQVIDTNPSDENYNMTLTTIPLTSTCDECTPVPAWVGMTPLEPNTPQVAYAYVTDTGQGAVQVIDTNPNDVETYDTVTAVVQSVGTTPNQIAITPDGTTAYVAIGANKDVAVIYTSTNTLQTPISVGNDPFGIAIGPAPPYEQATIGSGPQTVSFPFYNNGASISFSVPAGWCSAAPCTVNVTATDTPQSVWQTESSNYANTDITPVAALPGGGYAGGDGVVYTVQCTDANNNDCAQSSSVDYQTTLFWDTQLDTCSLGPALGKEETTTWENVLATCAYNSEPNQTQSGHSKDGLSRWAAFYGVSGSAASVNIVTPANGAVYSLGDVVDANYSCSGTAVVECAGTVSDVSPINTSSVGTYSFIAEADVNSGQTAVETVTYSVVNCHDVSFAFNPSTVTVGSFTKVTATVTSCSGTVEKKTVVDFILSGPFGRGCSVSQTPVLATPPFTLGTGALTFRFPLYIPAGACPGTYTVIAKTIEAGVVVDVSSSSLSVVR
jgi:YVTN family beta-propeller protein